MGLISQRVYDRGCHVLRVIPKALVPLEKIREIPNTAGGNLQFAFWTSRNNKSLPNPDDSITWRKEYHTIFLSAYLESQRIQINSRNYLVMTQTLCSLNGLTPAEVPSSLSLYETAN